MPYIRQDAKDDLHFLQPRDVGELTYKFTLIALSEQHYSDKYNDLLYAAKQYKEGSEKRFQQHAEVLGAFRATFREIGRRLDCCSLATGVIADGKWALETAEIDYYQQVIGPYEDTKIKTNGDVKEIQALISMPPVHTGP